MGELKTHPSYEVRVSTWSNSVGKRIFDCVLVMPVLILLIPVFILLFLAVYFTSSGPVFFVQGRLGRLGKIFPILKLRTMTHVPDGSHQAVATASYQCFTPIGKFLRRWKLDELPQLINVLLGHMSLVGPRPKLPEHLGDRCVLQYKPGITGAATIAFANEEQALSGVPSYHLKHYYHSVVLPKKIQLDMDYMEQATMLSDFKLLLKTVLRRWDSSIWNGLPDYDTEWDQNCRIISSQRPIAHTEVAVMERNS